MTPSNLDSLVADDLGALGAASRTDLPSLEDALRTATPGIYRDGRAGAEAKRDVLANERRLQLALMPLAIAQVFAHRVGRAAAGGMAIACALAMVMLVADPLLVRLVTWFVPGLGLNIGLCLTIASSAILVAYVVATWIAEAWFTRRMRAAIETHDDVYRDLDHLARGPIEVAQRLVRRVDGWSTGLLLAGVASLAAIFGYLVAVAGALRPASFVLSSTAVFSLPATTTNLGPVLYAIVFALLVAFVVGRACDREHRLGAAPAVLGRLGHWAMIPLGALGGLATLYGLFRMVTGYAWVAMVPSEHRYGLALLGEGTVIALAAWALLWWRRRERTRLGEGA